MNKCKDEETISDQNVNEIVSDMYTKINIKLVLAGFFPSWKKKKKNK